MSKTILYKLFKIGAIPRKIRPLIESEGIVLLDEGIKARLIMKNVKGPYRRHSGRAVFFHGSIVITRKRLLSFMYWKQIINISIEDPKLNKLYCDISERGTLSISFESSLFREGWKGIIEYRYKTSKAQEFFSILKSFGLKEGIAAG